MRNLENIICKSEICYIARDRILERLDKSVDPCEDFYRYSCGNYLKTHKVHDNTFTANTIIDLRNKVNHQLQKLLEEPIHDKELKLFQDVKKLYKACSNVEAIENLKVSPLIEKIETLGGWPVLGIYWNESNWKWEEIVQKLAQNGFSDNFIFSFFVNTKAMNSSRKLAVINAADLALKRKYLLAKGNGYEAYKNLQIDLLQVLGSKLSRNEIEFKMSQVLEFECSLANISLSKEDLSKNLSLSLNPMRIEELQVNYPYIDWLTHINNITPNEIQFASDDFINNAQPSYFEALKEILNQTSRETIANYLMWRVTFESLNYLNSPIRNRYFEYKEAVFGTKTQQKRELQCITEIKNLFPQGIGAMFVRKHFNQKTKNKVIKMLSNIKYAFTENLNNLTWMDNETKKAVKLKIKSMRDIIGSGDQLYNDTELERYYENRATEIDIENYFNSVLKIKAAKAKFNMNKLHFNMTKDDWTQYPSVVDVNAYMQFSHNRLVVLAALLQDPFYDRNRLKYLNYGSIGITLAHELTHAFDNVGSQYDENGNIKNWWSAETFKNFQDLKQCFIDQFNNLTEPTTGLHINGEQTQSENIADFGGIKFSYKAYEKFVEENGEEKLLPGIELNQRQLFWVAGAQFQCSVMRQELLEHWILFDTHAPYQFRVNAFGNLPEFSKDFKCSSTSAMNFIKKCELW